MAKAKDTVTAGQEKPLSCPTKDGTYTVQYKDDKGQIIREAVEYSKARGYKGAKAASFYEENVTSWFYGNIIEPGKALKKAYELLGRQ